MFRNVIVGVDEHQGGRDAIALANDLVAKDGELALAYVYLRSATPVRGEGGAFEASERQRALELLASARDEASIEARLLYTGSPTVGGGLHELAAAQRADLLVIGSCSRGLIGRVLVGDETRTALNGTRCAVAVAPSGYSERSPVLGEIGVGYNGSPESEQALAVARQLAAELGARVSAFEAVSLPAYLFARDSGPAIESTPAPYVEQALTRMAALGEVEPHAACGYPAEELALYSASVDLLVLGSRGYGPIGRLVHGSTAQELARTARCPLLVLTRAAGTTQQSDRTETSRTSAAAAH